MKLYQIFAQLAHKRKDISNPDQLEDIDIFANDLADKYLPHGSGFDIGCQIDLSKSSDQKLHITSAFHPMDEHGGYIAWIDFSVTVRASLVFGYTLDIKGPFSRRNLMMLKEYIGDEFFECLNREVSVNFRTLEEM